MKVSLMKFVPKWARLAIVAELEEELDKLNCTTVAELKVRAVAAVKRLLKV
jgi:hypothetical protein